jgi:hypothetical protein
MSAMLKKNSCANDGGSLSEIECLKKAGSFHFLPHINHI